MDTRGEYASPDMHSHVVGGFHAVSLTPHFHVIVILISRDGCQGECHAENHRGGCRLICQASTTKEGQSSSAW